MSPLTGLRQRLREGEPLIAMFSLIPSSEVVELIALAGFEAVILDMEHGAYGVETLGPLLLATRARGIQPLVRVLNSDPTGIGAALDAGAAGIIVPQISSAEEARRAVAAARFAPMGTRGANNFVRGADYSGRVEWFEEANNSVAIFLMVEGQGGVAALPDILAINGLDGVFIGPLDLSHALGVPGQMTHERVVSTIEDVIDRSKAAGLSAAIFAGTPEAAKRWLDRGVRLVGLGVDAGHIAAGFRAARNALKS